MWVHTNGEMVECRKTEQNKPSSKPVQETTTGNIKKKKARTFHKLLMRNTFTIMHLDYVK